MSDRKQRQAEVAIFVAAAFGSASTALQQRGLRFGEEAIEAMQAAEVPREMVHKLVDFVYDRPVGELAQELGGVGVTLLALAAAAGLCADTCEATEFARVLSKPLSHWAARNQAKNGAGFDLTKAQPAGRPGMIRVCEFRDAICDRACPPGRQCRREAGIEDAIS